VKYVTQWSVGCPALLIILGPFIIFMGLAIVIPDPLPSIIFTTISCIGGGVITVMGIASSVVLWYMNKEIVPGVSRWDMLDEEGEKS
jgi:hypothetical protein